MAVGEYEFVEIESEVTGQSIEELRKTRDAIKDEFRPKPINAGVPDKEYNSFIDNMLLGGDNHIDVWEKLSDKQRDSAQVIKRALKRLEAKNKEQ